jgi:PEP-CTERM motif
MRNPLFTFALLASALTLPLAARADTIDDFTLVGDGSTFTFSLPASFTVANHPHLDSALLGNVATSVNGVNGYSSALTIYLPLLAFRSGFDIYVAPSGSGGGPIYDYQLQGPSLADQPTEPFIDPLATVTFLPGTYELSTFLDGIPFLTKGGIPFTLTIAPETAATPEPGTLFLFATGALGIITAARRRLSV